jgi:hypothetical protein
MVQPRIDHLSYVSFKGPREKEEWLSGGAGPEATARDLHPALYVAVLAAGLWHFRRTGEPALVTCLLRTREEQQAIYPGRPDLRSPHEFGRAADLRTRHLPPATAREWAVWLNRTFDYLGRTGAATALIHEVGGRGTHLHLQIGPREPVPRATEISPAVT